MIFVNIIIEYFR